MNKKIRHRKNKGEKMSLRKITTLLLLLAFAMTQVPVQAAELTVTGTLPTTVIDSGTSANGANRDVVPVNLRINTNTSGELFFGRYTQNGTFAITENGQLTTGGATIVPATSVKVLVIEPPTGTQFVGLDGYNGTVTTALLEPLDTGNTGTNVNVTTSTNVPGSGTEDTAILAKIITEAGPVATFGQVVPAGSIVMYPVTNSTSNSSTGETDITFTNIGLSVPAGSSITAANATYQDITIGTDVEEAVPSLTDGATITISTVTTDANGQIAVALDSTEPDAESNSVLADLLSNAGNTVKVSTNYITSDSSDGTNQSILYVDTDALLIQAGETPTSTSMTPAYYPTPFNTSSFLSSTRNGNNVTQLNAALTSSSFPNSANALITVTYSLAPLTGNGSTDATLVVNAASVSLMDQGTNDGYLGALKVAVADGNGDAVTPANFAVAVLYQGANATTALRTQDFDLLNDATTNVITTSNGVGFDFLNPPSSTKIPVASASAATFVNSNGNLATGLFPGVTIAQADAIGTTARAIQNGNPLTNVVNTAAGFTVSTVGEQIWAPNEVTVRLLPTGGNAIFGIFGNEAGQDLSEEIGNGVVLGPTNLATVPYEQGAILQSSSADFNDVKNNLIMVSRLAGNVVQIMPLQNKLDGARDVIKVRPEATITLGTNSKAQGVRLIATITGNNIAGSKVVEIARVRAAGVTDADLAVSALPASGDLDSLLAENGDDASTLRVPIDPADINATDTDLASLVANGSVLDDTLPSFFCGGTAGTITNGPNSVPTQLFARSILVQETTAKEFDNFVDGGGNDVIRFLMPVGVDLFKVSGTPSSNDVAVISSDAGTAGTFAASPAVVAYETISNQNGGQAFIDVSFGTSVAGSDDVKKAIALIFGSRSLVIPEGQTDFDVEVALVTDDGTDSRTNDIVQDVLGAVAIADGCSEQFSIAYCDDALANFAIAEGPVESDLISNGSELTSFTAPTSTIRLLNDTGAPATQAFQVPDICVTELTDDALPVGSTNTTPNIFGPGYTLSLAVSNPVDGAAANVGFSAAGGIGISDDSLSPTAPALGGGLINTTVTAGTGTDDFLEMTTFRFNGLLMAKTASNFQPSAQSFTAFLNDGTDHYGTTFPASFETRGANGTAFTALARDGGTDEEIAINTFFNGDVHGVSAGATPSVDSGDFSNGGYVTTAFANTNSPILMDAIKLINDTASVYDTLSEDTKLSIAVDEIPAVTNGLAAYTRITVFTSAGELEPGSMISVQSPDDLVTVPVNTNGNFTARLRGEQGDTLVITQTPTSDRTTEDQTVVIEAQNQNLEPTLLSAVSQNFTSIGTITQQGTAPVLFKLTAVGRIGTEVFAPSASDLRIGGTGPVYAVPGTTDMFLAIVDFRKTDGAIVSAPNVTGAPSVSITGMDVDFATFPKKSRPILARARTRTKKNSDTRVVFQGNRLRNSGVGFLILEDGSVEEVTFRNRTKSDRSKNRVVSEGTDSIPADAVFAVYHVPGRGIFTLDLN